ncbi:zinc finger protein 665-like [Labrus bergylta]|uniref:zinc finger protein 665-like n=1 Tax=Labrus bergylta TaxID=56723 RepID=UPI0033135012
MSGFEDLKDLFRRRLFDAAHRDPRGQTTTCGYEEELLRQRQLLDVILTPEIKLQRTVFPAVVQLLMVKKEEVPPEQQECSPSLDQEDTKHFKEGQEELSRSQVGEQLQGREDADTNKFPFTPVPVKSEDDEEKPQSSQLNQRQIKQMETGADSEDCVGAEPETDSDRERHLQPEIEVKTEDSTEPETFECNYLSQAREHPSGLNSVERNEDKGQKTDKTSHECAECGKTFKMKCILNKHMKVHTGEKPFSCLKCGKRFTRKHGLTTHMISHTGEKPFSCSECGKRFNRNGSLKLHMVHHTGEKVFSCSECGKIFNNKNCLTRHILVHTGEKPFSCSFCSKRFTQKGHLISHMLVHTGEKLFRCSECGKRFKRNYNLTVHMTCHTGEKSYTCSVCDQRFFWHSQLKRHACAGVQVFDLYQNQTEEKRERETGADEEDCGGAEPERVSDPERKLKPETKVKTEDLNGDCKKTREHHSGLNLLRHYDVSKSSAMFESDRKQLFCLESDQLFSGSCENQLTQRECLCQHIIVQRGENRGVKQEDTEPPLVKEEQEEVWISHAETTKFPFTPVCVKSEDDDEKPQSSELHQEQTEQIETRADGEDCGGSEPDRDFNPDSHLQTVSIDETPHLSGSDTDDSGDWERSNEPQEGLNPLQNKNLPVSDMNCNTQNTSVSSSECATSFGQKKQLQKNKEINTGEKPFSCSVCGKRFTQSGTLKRHTVVHTGEKPFSCTLCGKRFTRRGTLKHHSVVHTGEKPFSCVLCGHRFASSGDLKRHTIVHTREKPFSCLVCGHRFTDSGSLKSHSFLHTGEKPFSCSICGKRFTQRGVLKRHSILHSGEKQFSCSVCGKRFTRRGTLKHHSCIHTGETSF